MINTTNLSVEARQLQTRYAPSGGLQPKRQRMAASTAAATAPVAAIRPGVASASRLGDAVTKADGPDAAHLSLARR